MPPPILAQVIFYQPATGRGYLRVPATCEEFFFTRRNLREETVTAGQFVHCRIRENKQGYYADEIVAAGLA